MTITEPQRPCDGHRLVFLDCEFTTLEDPKLLSLGLVADGEKELYAALAGDAHLKRASSFVLDTMVPQFGRLPYAETSLVDIGKRIGGWLLEFNEPTIDILYDFHVDKDLLEGALRAAGLWARLEQVLISARPTLATSLKNPRSRQRWRLPGMRRSRPTVSSDTMPWRTRERCGRDTLRCTAAGAEEVEIQSSLDAQW